MGPKAHGLPERRDGAAQHGQRKRALAAAADALRQIFSSCGLLMAEAKTWDAVRTSC
jgi:hypothetical protein